MSEIPLRPLNTLLHSTDCYWLW